MSFNHYARKVRNPALTIWARKSALGSCVVKVMWLTGERYTSILARLNRTYSFETADGKAPNEAGLLAALAALETERNRVIEALREFDRNRAESKIRGNRQLSKLEFEHMTAIQRGGIDPSISEQGTADNRQYR